MSTLQFTHVTESKLNLRPFSKLIVKRSSMMNSGHSSNATAETASTPTTNVTVIETATMEATNLVVPVIRMSFVASATDGV